MPVDDEDVDCDSFDYKFDDDEDDIDEAVEQIGSGGGNSLCAESMGSAVALL